MIELLATAESFEQAKHLIDCGVDTIYIGEETYGLRLPYSFSREEQRAVITYAHAHGRKVNVAVNAILHNDQIKTVPSYLTFLKENGVDRISVGDTGLIQLLKQPDYYIPFIYDAETIVTNHRQVDFWAKYGAVGAVAAREVPFEELQKMAQATLPIEVLVYGATCIHQSKRKLMRNYFNFIEKGKMSVVNETYSSLNQKVMIPTIRFTKMAAALISSPIMILTYCPISAS